MEIWIAEEPRRKNMNVSINMKRSAAAGDRTNYMKQTNQPPETFLDVFFPLNIVGTASDARLQGDSLWDIYSNGDEGCAI